MISNTLLTVIQPKAHHLHTGAYQLTDLGDLDV